MVAPPGFSIAERYKQYTCVGQTFSSIPSSVPTTAPSVSSSLAPTLTSVVSWSPTYGAGNAPGSVAVATVAVIQTQSKGISTKSRYQITDHNQELVLKLCLQNQNTKKHSFFFFPTVPGSGGKRTRARSCIFFS